MTAQEKSAENTVFIGRKPTKNYVLAVLAQINQGATEVSVKARGKSISKAVDVAEILKNRFIPDIKISGIDIATEKLTSEEGVILNVSSIDIKLKK